MLDRGPPRGVEPYVSSSAFTSGSHPVSTMYSHAAPPDPHPTGRRRLRRLGVVGILAATLWSGAGCDVGNGSTTARTHRAPAPTQSVPAEEHPGVPRQLRVVSHPAGASLTMKGADGRPHIGVTPFVGTAPGGRLQLSLAMDGFNTVQEEIVLDADRAVELWLDRKGLLHRSLGIATSGSNPKQVAFTPDGKELWVTLLGGRGIDVFEFPSRRRLSNIRLGQNGAVEVIFTRDGKTAFASQMESASVFEIDRQSFQVRRQMVTKGSWSKVMALAPDEKTLYVANWSSDNVSEIDLASGQVRRLLPTVRTPRGLHVSADGRLFVAGFENGELARINLADGSSPCAGQERWRHAPPDRGQRTGTSVRQ